MKIAIIGSGNLGLGIAYILRKDGHTITIFEKEKKIGGAATYFSKDWDSKRYNFPVTYRHFSDRPSNLRILRELGLEEEAFFTAPKAALILQDDHLFDFGLIGLVLRRDVPLATKFRAAGVILQNVRLRKSPLRIGYFKKNSNLFFKSLIPALIRHNIQLLNECAIDQIDFRYKEIEYAFRNQKKRERFDSIITTIPPKAVARLAKKNTLPNEVLVSLDQVSYGTVYSLVIGINAPVDCPYFFHIRNKTFPFDEIINFTDFTTLQNDKRILYLVSYDKKLHGKSDKEIAKLFIKHLKRIIPATKGCVSWTKLFRIKSCRDGPLLTSIPQLSEKMLQYDGNYFFYHDFKKGACMNARRFLHNISRIYFEEESFGLFPEHAYAITRRIPNAK